MNAREKLRMQLDKVLNLEGTDIYNLVDDVYQEGYEDGHSDGESQGWDDGYEYGLSLSN